MPRAMAAALWRELHAYVLMTNHAHLLMTPDEACLISRLMQHIGRLYVLRRSMGSDSATA